MTTTDLATTSQSHGSALVLQSDQDFWNDKQLAALRQLGVDKASPGDLAVFMHVSQRTGLDPFARQIYLIERQGKQTIQTGIDGFRLVARRAVDRSGETLSIGSAEWCGHDGAWTDVWLADGPPAAARVTVMRDGQPFVGVALFREYAQTKRDGDLTHMWATRSAGQIAKCAEALAIRKAFPQDLSGIYSDDEMSGAAGQRIEHRRRGGLGGALATQRAQAPESPVLDVRSDLAKRMFATFNEIGLTDRDARLAYVTDVVGREVTSSEQMTDADASAVIAALHRDLEPPASSDAPVQDVTDGELVDEPNGGEA